MGFVVQFTAPQQVDLVEEDIGEPDLVWGVWGHRSEAVGDAARLSGHVPAEHIDPPAGVSVMAQALAPRWYVELLRRSFRHGFEADEVAKIFQLDERPHEASQAVPGFRS